MMLKVYDPSSDYRNWWNLGSTVRFDGPDGERLQGEIVRVYCGGGFHVLVDGVRYEVDSTNSMEMVW
jgi:hypothetical protein